MKQSILFSFGAVLGIAYAKCDPSTIQSALPRGASVNFAYPLTANSTFEVPKSDTGYPTNAFNLPALCAVSVQVQSIANSTYGFGLFLPDDWNGRFLAVGNGGFAGGINYVDMVRVPKRKEGKNANFPVGCRRSVWIRLDVDRHWSQLFNPRRFMGISTS
jgi:feruloyl esterase